MRGLVKVNCEIINHFGKNPINGGIPPRERRNDLSIILRGPTKLVVLLKLLVVEDFVFEMSGRRAIIIDIYITI